MLKMHPWIVSGSGRGGSPTTTVLGTVHSRLTWPIIEDGEGRAHRATRLCGCRWCRVDGCHVMRVAFPRRNTRFWVLGGFLLAAQDRARVHAGRNHPCPPALP